MHISNFYTTTQKNDQIVWSVYTMEYYSAIKNNEPGSFVVMHMDLESVIQSEVSPKEENRSSINTYLYMESRKVVQMNLLTRQEL